LQFLAVFFGDKFFTDGPQKFGVDHGLPRSCQPRIHRPIGHSCEQSGLPGKNFRSLHSPPFTALGILAALITAETLRALANSPHPSLLANGET
jgi:hypothetical protein